jgi:hypothetical protein
MARTVVVLKILESGNEVFEENDLIVALQSWMMWGLAGIALYT